MRIQSQGQIYDYGDIIRIPLGSRVIAVTDIHGNYEDFQKYVNIWRKGGPNCHIVFLGDLIHGLKKEEDKSIEILKDIYELNNFQNFHVLIGNHEIYQIRDEPIYKNGIDQVKEFNEILQEKDMEWFGEIAKELMGHFKKMAVLPNGLILTHAGPTRNMIHIMCEINQGLTLSQFFSENYIENSFENMSFARPWEDYTPKDVDDFLEATNCKAMLVGHTPNGGYGAFGNQIIMDSSFETKKKCYLSMMSDEPITCIEDVEKCIFVLEEK